MEGLGTAGKALYDKIRGDLPAGVEFDPRELELLAQAAVCADTIAALDAVVAEQGTTARGSTGQVVLHPALQEARMQRVVLLRLLQALELPEEPAEETPARARARAAAQARWSARDDMARRKAR